MPLMALKTRSGKVSLAPLIRSNDKSIYRFPQNYIRASFQRDTKIPGAALQFVQEDNFLLSFKRGEKRQHYLYNYFYRLDYVHEYEKPFSRTASA